MTSMTHFRNPAIIGMLLLFGIVGMLVLSDTTPPTGMVIAEPKGASFYGAYLPKPEITSTVNFDTGIYQKIAAHLPILSACADKGTPLETCLATAQAATGFTWEPDCMKGKERVFYDIIETFEDCLNSSESNCYCEKNLGSSSYIAKNGLSGHAYTFAMRKDGNSISFADDSGALSYASSLRGIASTYLPEKLALTYGDTGLAKAEAQITTMPLSGTAPVSLPSLLFYKHSPQKEGKAEQAIDLIMESNGKLAYPTSAMVTDGAGRQLSKADLRPCTPKPKTVQRFCVSDPAAKYMIHDPADGETKERPITIRFAAHLPDSPPPPLTGVKALDYPKADYSAILSWEESSAPDTTSYRIYRASSPEALSSTPIAELSAKEGVSVITARTEDAEDLNAAVDVGACTFDYSLKQCVFSAGEKKVLLKRPKGLGEQGQLYRSRTADGRGVYLYPLLIMENGKEQSFAVTAVDRNGNEIDNVKQKFSVIPGTSVDDLPPRSEGIVGLLANLFSSYDKGSQTLSYPSFTPPTRNIDNTLLLSPEPLSYAAYGLKNPAIAISPDTPLSLFSALPVSTASGGLSISLKETNPKEGDTYYLVLVAQDAAGNPKPGQFTPKEIGATVQTLTIS